MQWSVALLALVAAVGAVAPEPRKTCPTPNDYFSSKGGYWGVALTYKHNQSESYWTALDGPSQTMMTTNLLPGDFMSRWYIIDPYVIKAAPRHLTRRRIVSNN